MMIEINMIEMNTIETSKTTKPFAKPLTIKIRPLTDSEIKTLLKADITIHDIYEMVKDFAGKVWESEELCFSGLSSKSEMFNSNRINKPESTSKDNRLDTYRMWLIYKTFQYYISGIISEWERTQIYNVINNYFEEIATEIYAAFSAYKRECEHEEYMNKINEKSFPEKSISKKSISQLRELAFDVSKNHNVSFDKAVDIVAEVYSKLMFDDCDNYDN